MKLLFIHGLPGVGKLTVAKELSRLTGFPIFHNHLTVDLVTSLFEFGSEPFVELRERIWLDTFSQAASSSLRGMIFTFVFERTVRDEFLPKVVKTLAAHGGEVIFVKLVCERNELEKRMTDPERNKFGKLTSVEQFKELDSAGVFKTPKGIADCLTIDTSRISPAEAARQIVDGLERRL